MATEFHLEFKEGFKQGLRREDTNEKNSQLLTKLANARVTEYGLKPPVELTQALSSYPENQVFPFPQLFIGKGVSLLAYDTNVYQVSSSWTATTPLTIYSSSDPETEAAIPSTGGPWHFIDLHDFWMLTRTGTTVDPGCTIYFCNKEGMWFGGVNYALLQTSMTIGAGCYHRGRIILGRFNYENFWNTTWGSLFNYWQNTAPSAAHTSFESEVDAPGSNYVMWSSIGGGDFPLAFFDSELVSTPGMLPGTPGYSEGEPWIFQALRKNEIGWMPMPFQGNVLAIKPLGNDVIVYGSNGIVRMSNVNVGLGVAMSCQRIADIGIATETSVGGDEEQHLFIGTDGNVWTLSANGQLARLGYKEFVSTYRNSTTIVAHDPVNRHFYISLGGQVWLVTQQGMSQLLIYDGISGMVHKEGYTRAVFTDYSSAYTNTYVEVISDTIDMGHRGLKTITRVELGYSSSNSDAISKRVQIQYRTTEGGLWAWSGSATALSTDYSDGFPVNNDGVAWCYVTGVEFRIYIKVSSTADYTNPNESFHLDWMNVWYMNVDKRFRRGV